jgi:hypothetical protein
MDSEDASPTPYEPEKDDKFYKCLNASEEHERYNCLTKGQWFIQIIYDFFSGNQHHQKVLALHLLDWAWEVIAGDWIE